MLAPELQINKKTLKKNFLNNFEFKFSTEYMNEHMQLVKDISFSICVDMVHSLYMFDSKEEFIELIAEKLKQDFKNKLKM
jgi:hypothetical protein